MYKSKDKKVKVKTWQFSFFLAAVVLIFFLLIHCQSFSQWLCRDIPHPYFRTFAAGLLLAVLVFLFSGVHLHYMCPVKERSKTKTGFSPLGVIDR